MECLTFPYTLHKQRVTPPAEIKIRHQPFNMPLLRNMGMLHG